MIADDLIWPILNAGGALLLGLFLHRLLIGRLLPRVMVVGSDRVGYRYSRKIAMPALLLVLLVSARLLIAGWPRLETQAETYFTLAFAFIGAALVIETVRYLVVEYLLEHYYTVAIPVLVVDIGAVLVYFVIAITILSTTFQVAVLPLLTTSTVVSIVLGLALQDTLGNLVAGIALQMDRPYQLGDWIEFVGADGQRQAGRVVEITWRSTILASLSDERIVVPNKTMNNITVYNYSHPSARVLRTLNLHLPLHLPPTRAKELILEVVRHVPGVLAEPAPLADIREYDAGLIKYVVVYWIADFPSRMVIAGHILEQLWYQFKRHGVELPAPPRQVYVSRSRPEPEAEPEPPASLAERLAVLKRVDYLSVLGEEELAFVAERMEPVLYGAGEILFEQGASEFNFYIVESGEVVLSVRGEDDMPVVKGRLGPGGFFGEVSLLTGTIKAAAVSFARDTRLYVIRKPIFDQLFARDPEAPQRMSRLLTRRDARNMAGQPFVTSFDFDAGGGHEDDDESEEEKNHNHFLKAIKAFFGLR